MDTLKLNSSLRKKIDEFVRGLEDLYKEDLVSVILYGSAASGEFIDAHSNLNLLVVLRNIGLDNIKKSSGLVNKHKFKMFMPLFFSREYIASSTDVFPIEFLDMKENYVLLAGENVLKDISVDLKNLRFQCEHELKLKLIHLRQFFLKRNKDKDALKDTLFKSTNSVIHILRNIIRIKGKAPAYLKQDIIKQIKDTLPVDTQVWSKILAAKNKQVRLSTGEIDQLFKKFIDDLEKVVDVVDKL
jgi:predicted nucleotidyltransferase